MPSSYIFFIFSIAGCSPVPEIPDSGSTLLSGIITSGRADVRLVYWSSGIRVFKPSLPPFNLTKTNILSVWVNASASEPSNFPYALTGCPFIAKGNKDIGATLFKKSLLFMVSMFYESWYSLRFIMYFINADSLVVRMFFLASSLGLAM